MFDTHANFCTKIEAVQHVGLSKECQPCRTHFADAYAGTQPSAAQKQTQSAMLDDLLAPHRAYPDGSHAPQATYFGMIWTNGAGASTGMFVPALAVGATGGRMAGRIVKAVVRYALSAGVCCVVSLADALSLHSGHLKL